MPVGGRDSGRPRAVALDHGGTADGRLPPTPATGRAGPSCAARRRPLAVVAGLVLSFSVFTLLGSWLLSPLGLPQDLLRWIGLVVLGLVGWA